MGDDWEATAGDGRDGGRLGGTVSGGKRWEAVERHAQEAVGRVRRRWGGNGRGRKG